MFMDGEREVNESVKDERSIMVLTKLPYLLVYRISKLPHSACG